MSQSTGQTDRVSGKADALDVLAFVLTAGVVALGVGGPYFIGLVEYWGGVRGVGVGRGFLLGLGLKPLMVLVSLFVLLTVIVAARLTPGSLTWKRMLLSVLLPAICLLTMCFPTRPAAGLAAMYLQGFERRMLKTADIDAIQQWLSAEGVKYAGQELRDKFPEEFPRYLVELHPWRILFSDVTVDGNVMVEFRWYAPHGENYGLIVGPPFVQTPPEGTIRLDDGWQEFRRPVKPGAYVFARG